MRVGCSDGLIGAAGAWPGGARGLTDGTKPPALGAGALRGRTGAGPRLLARVCDDLQAGWGEARARSR